VFEKCEICELTATCAESATYVDHVPDPAEPLLPSGEIAKRIGVSVRTIGQWVTDGVLVPDVVTPHGRYRWRWSSVERQLREQRRTDT
jgi:MerR HTH family regulatory protein